MSTPPIVELPESACFAEILFSIERVVGLTVSPYSRESQAFKWPGEQWKVDLTLPPMTNRAVANEWKAFGVAMEGKYGQFYIGDPSGKEPLGVATGTPLVDGAGQLGNTLNTKGWTHNITNILKAGDYIQVGTGVAARLHMNMTDVDSDGSGDAELTLQPALRYAPADGVAITVHNPVGLFRLASNSFSWRVSPGPVYRISLQAEEVVSA